MQRQWRLLDLFCKAGGAGMGYHLAGFEVRGVDIEPQPRYPFLFLQADVLGPDIQELIEWADVIHASPPCQEHSDLKHRTGKTYPDLIAPTRQRLLASGKPFIIENVEGAPLVNPIMLCGTMFHGLRVLRHRLFESNLFLLTPAHGEHPLVFTHDKRKAHYGRLDQDRAFVQVTGGGNCTLENAKKAMGIDWMTKDELNQAIPPAYTEFIGRQIIAQLEAVCA